VLLLVAETSGIGCWDNSECAEFNVSLFDWNTVPTAGSLALIDTA
jgi:hypothetical protein